MDPTARVVVQSRDGPLELALRGALRRLRGVPLYVVREELPGGPYLAFPKLKVAVFVRECLWHRCPLHYYEQVRRAVGAERRLLKMQVRENFGRDRQAMRELRELGWYPMTVWEHELRADPDAAAVRVLAVLEVLRGAPQRFHGKAYRKRLQGERG